MKNHERILKSIVGDEGYQTLEKAIYRRQTQSVADPLELYLPLMVVPRTILSWLVQNIQTLKNQEHKELDMPGREGVKLWVQKQSTDVYRGEIIEGGKVIHSFDHQSLPSIGGHLMTVFEDYDHLVDKPVVMDRKDAVQEHEKLVAALKSPSKKDDREELKEQTKELAEYKAGTEKAPADSSQIVRTIMNMNGCSIESADPAAVQAMVQLASVQALTQTVGKLVDALVAKKVESISKEEIPGDKQEVKETPMPPKQVKSKDVIQDMSPKEYIQRTRLNTVEESVEEAPDPKTVKAGEQAADAEPKKDSIAKDEMPKLQTTGKIKPKKPKTLRNAYSSVIVSTPLGLTAPQGVAAAPAVGKTAADEKGVHPDLSQWGTGPKGVSGAGRNVRTKIPHQIDEAKGWHRRKLAELKTIKPNLPKAELDKSSTMPGGAGMQKQPKAPTPPNGPVPASNNPAAAAAKQSLAAGQGKQMMPAKGAANKPMPKAVKSEYNPQNPAGKEIPKILDRPASHPGHRNLRSLIKAPKEHHVTESELYARCEHCGKAEFTKSEAGPKFTPCACFVAMVKDEEGNAKHFVALKKAGENYSIAFSPDVDPEEAKAFLLTLKSKLLLKKKFGIDL